MNAKAQNRLEQRRIGFCTPAQRTLGLVVAYAAANSLTIDRDFSRAFGRFITLQKEARTAFTMR